MRRPLLLGHRGARALRSIPENTLASFDQALADGCDGFEFDVRLTGDGHAVVCHDPQVDRIEIAQAAVKQLPSLPTLESVLSRYQKRAFLDIELKVAGLETLTADLLHKHPIQPGYVISSFLPEVLQAVAAKDAETPLGLICETKAQLRGWTKLPIGYVIAHHKLATRSMVRQVQDAGRKLLVWTVNSAADMRRFADYGVDGIISDDAGLLHRTLSGQPPDRAAT